MTRPGRFAVIAALSAVVLIGAVLWLRPARATARPVAASSTGRMLHVRVWEPGGVAPTVNVNVPVFVISAAVKVASATGLLDSATVSACGEEDRGTCPRLRGKDLAAIWRQISTAGPMKVIDVDDGDGNRVEIRID